jgi:hypothetical protein
MASKMFVSVLAASSCLLYVLHVRFLLYILQLLTKEASLADMQHLATAGMAAAAGRLW